MYRIVILILGSMLLSGCFYNQNEVIERGFFEDIGNKKYLPDQNKLIQHVSIKTLGNIGLYDDDIFYDVMLDNPGCKIGDDDRATDSKKLYCKGVKGYNHLYKVPSLKLEYIYNSEYMYTSFFDEDNRFFRSKVINNPFIVSGNYLYWSNTPGLYSGEDLIIINKKNINESEKSIIQGFISSDCDYRIGDDSAMGTGIYSNNNIYSVSVYKNMDLMNEGRKNLCIPSLPANLGNDYRIFIFSKTSKNYYYLVGPSNSNLDGNMIYNSDSLKLFVD